MCKSGGATCAIHYVVPHIDVYMIYGFLDRCLGALAGLSSIRRSISSHLIHRLLNRCVQQASGFFLAAAARALGHQALQFSFASACDSSRSCRRVLEAEMGRGACLWSNILDRCPAARRLFLRSGTTCAETFNEAWRVITQGGCASSGGRCYTHNSFDCPTPKPDGDMSGSPCKLWSSFGKRQGRCWARDCLRYSIVHARRMCAY